MYLTLVIETCPELNRKADSAKSFNNAVGASRMKCHGTQTGNGHDYLTAVARYVIFKKSQNYAVRKY